MRQNNGLEPFRIDTDALDGILSRPTKILFSLEQISSDESEEQEEETELVPLPKLIETPPVISAPAIAGCEMVALSLSPQSNDINSPTPYNAFVTTAIDPPEQATTAKSQFVVTKKTTSPKVTTSLPPTSRLEIIRANTARKPVIDLVCASSKPNFNRFFLTFRKLILLFGSLAALVLFWKMIKIEQPLGNPIPANVPLDKGILLPQNNSSPSSAPTKAIIYSGALISLPLKFLPGAIQPVPDQNSINTAITEIRKTKGDIILVGHAAPTVESSSLGLQRARYVQQLLVNKGIASKRIQIASRPQPAQLSSSEGSLEISSEKVAIYIEPIELIKMLPGDTSHSRSAATYSSEDLINAAHRSMIVLPLSFESGKWKTKVGLEKIRAIAAKIRTGNKNVLLVGHTDSRGSRQSNLIIGLWRAEFVRELFLKEGIAYKRIVIASRGSSQPLYKEDSPEKLASNRRVDFRLFTNTK